MYGIVNDSILNELAYFHVIGRLAPDVMHDILEGIPPLVLSKLLLHCLQKKYFSLKKLNSKIEKFAYGHREVIDKPSPITLTSLHSGDINQSASQLWLLSITFPLMVGALVDNLTTRGIALQYYSKSVELFFLNQFHIFK